MSKTQFPGEIPREALVDAPDDEWLGVLLENYNQTQRQLNTSLKRGLTTAENTTSGEKELDLTHGVESTCSNPLKVPIKGIYALSCNGLVLDSLGRPTGEVYPLANPIIEWRSNGKSDGGVLIKATYPAPVGCLRLALSANQTALASASNVAVSYTAQRIVFGDAFSHSTSVNPNAIACNYDGYVRFSAVTAWSTRSPAAGDGVGHCVTKNGSIAAAGTRWGQVQLGCQGNVPDLVSSSDVVQVSAGDYLEVLSRQSNAAAAARDLVGNSNRECTLDVRYTDPADDTVGRVNLFFYGG